MTPQSREEILQNLHKVVNHGIFVSSLKLKCGDEFQSDALILAEEGFEGVMEACDDEHPDGLKFTVDDIIELEIF